MNLFRVCVIAALLSLSQAGYSLIRPWGFAGGSHTLLQRVWEVSLLPAIILSYAVLPKDYTRFHCFDEGPAHQDLVASSVFVFTHVVFWTTFATVVFLIFRFYQRGTDAPGRRWVHSGLIFFGAIIAPLLVLALYFLFSGNANQRNMDFDVFAIIVSALIGCTLLSVLPVTIWRRFFIVAVYVPIAFYALVACSRFLAFKLFGDRL